MNKSAIIVFLASYLMSFGTYGQVEKTPIPSYSKNLQAVLDSLPQLDHRQVHEALIIGSFHFNSANDGSDVKRKNKLNVLSPENQEEILSLVEALKAYKPTRIGLEFKVERQALVDSLYNAYLENQDFSLGKNEHFQLGFRLAKALGHKRVYCLDNRPEFPETVNSVDDWDAYADSLGQSHIMHSYDVENKQYNDYVDLVFSERLSLKEYLLALNSEPFTRRTKQLWLAGLVHLGAGGKYLGADLTGNWYRRNVRIFTNAFKSVEQEKEKLLIIYGASHKFALDEIFEAAPEFKLRQLHEFVH